MGEITPIPVTSSSSAKMSTGQTRLTQLFSDTHLDNVNMNVEIPSTMSINNKHQDDKEMKEEHNNDDSENSILRAMKRMKQFIQLDNYQGPTTERQRSKMKKQQLLHRNMEIQAEQLWLDREYESILKRKENEE